MQTNIDKKFSYDSIITSTDSLPSLRKLAEEKVTQTESQKPGNNLYAKFFHELQVHQIEMEMQNEELRRFQTEGKLAQDLLMESEKKYRKLVDNANEGIVVAQDGILKFVNRKMEEMTGYSQQKLITKPFSELIHPDDREMVVTNYNKRINGEQVSPRYNFRLLSVEGLARWIEIGAVLIEWQGRPATLNFLTDITKRKLAEQSLFQKLDELERFNNLAINRELKMIELKEEINELLRKSGEIPKYKIVGTKENE